MKKEKEKKIGMGNQTHPRSIKFQLDEECECDLRDQPKNFEENATIYNVTRNQARKRDLCFNCFQLKFPISFDYSFIIS